MDSIFGVEQTDYSGDETVTRVLLVAAPDQRTAVSVAYFILPRGTAEDRTVSIIPGLTIRDASPIGEVVVL